VVCGRWEDTAGKAAAQKKQKGQKNTPEPPETLFSFRGESHLFGISKAPKDESCSDDIVASFSEMGSLICVQTERGPDRIPGPKVQPQGHTF
jgi:hypothetical protein